MCVNVEVKNVKFKNKMEKWEKKMLYIIEFL